MKTEMATSEGIFEVTDKDKEFVTAVFHKFVWEEGKKRIVDVNIGLMSIEDIKRLAKSLQ